MAGLAGVFNGIGTRADFTAGDGFGRGWRIHLPWRLKGKER
jgi:hypothetical protein